MTIDLTDAIERAMLMAENNLLPQSSYDLLTQKLKDEDLHSFTMALVDRGIITKTTRREEPEKKSLNSEKISKFLMTKRMAQMFGDFDSDPLADPSDVYEDAPVEDYGEAPPEVSDPAPLVYIPVESSNIQEMAYSDEESTLYIRFHGKGGGSSSLYAYYNVPAEVNQEMLGAESKGKFLWSNIRGVYDYERVE